MKKFYRANVSWLLLLILIIATSFFQLNAEGFSAESSWTCREFGTALDMFLECLPTEIVKLEELYALLESLRDERIVHSIETYYIDGAGERPAPSILDRNLRYTLFIEEVYLRIDQIKITAAGELEKALAPLPNLSEEIRVKVEAMADLNRQMGSAVAAAEDSFYEMIEIRNDYLEVLKLQREVMRASLKTRGPKAILLAGIGASGSTENPAALSAVAGFLYNFGSVDLGFTATAAPDLAYYGASLLLGLNIK